MTDIVLEPGKNAIGGFSPGSNNGKVYTIEGNSSDRVRRNDYSLNSSSIYGYGVVG